ncbi:MAG: hopanoid biosynthesis-associated protein HpnK [Verrucomicrobia bacterium]|nr:hopanoid biosynthesis-associated protein HpnK [Verrucomicrobiota bacterium]MDE3097905.1 hopanoid biosynthesis-associated protein HpnK [Verrucomicrobiota bacterium]
MNPNAQSAGPGGRQAARAPGAFQASSGGAARRLIVNADDFGLSHEVNEAVILAHREGILTTASLMVAEAGFEEAVHLAAENPTLGVGLHVTLLMGRSVLPPAKIPALVDSNGRFSDDPVWTGMRFFFNRRLRDQLRAEIHAQFEKFRRTGLRLDHVNGHLHLHLHPVIFEILMEDAKELGIRHFRFTRDCLRRSRKMARGRWIYRFSHAAIYDWLSRRAREPLRRRGIRHAEISFGLLQDARVDEQYVLKLLRDLPEGDSELYSHPSLNNFRHEFEALISPRVRELVETLGIQRIRYQDL